jgi:hypothetical protein
MQTLSNKEEYIKSGYGIETDSKGKYAKVANCFGAGDCIFDLGASRVLVTTSSIENVGDLVTRLTADGKPCIYYPVQGGTMIERVEGSVTGLIEKESIIQSSSQASSVGMPLKKMSLF